MDTRRRLRLYVGSWVLAALVVAAVSATVTRTAPVDWPLVSFLWAGAIATAVVHVRVRVRGTTEASNFIEAAIVPILVLLDPLHALVVGGAAALVAETILTRGQAQKLAFNWSSQLVGLAAGAWAFHLVVGSFGSDPGSVELLGATIAGLLYVTLNMCAFTGIIALQARRSWWSVMGEELASLTVIGAGNVLAGVLATVLVVTAPLALPLLAIPMLLQHGHAQARSEGQHRLEAERERLRRTVEGSSDGVVLLDRRGRVEVWNPAMQLLTAVPSTRATGATLADLHLGGLLRGDVDAAGGHRLQVQDRTVEVRRTRPDAASRYAGSVLSVRDVTREAELAQIRDDLVSRISHELRTPLTTMAGFLEVLQSRWPQLDDDRRLELVGAALRGAGRLSTLVSDLMAWARIEARERDPRPPGEATSDVGAVLDLLATGDGVGPDTRVQVGPDHHVALSVDELRHVLRPLLLNATTHGRPPVTVTAECEGDRHRLVVRDAGTGLPRERVQALFDPFAQGTQGLQRTDTGLGLGLAISRGTAELAGGSLTYEVSPEGHAFVATLPSA